ncbi:DUF2813 domain-containing protein [Sesbania bispinosa]|nr:DUF2813 domain-containing protein [Sesbania bispinosa]
MAKSRPSCSKLPPEDSSSSYDSSCDFIPRSISFTVWTHLPPPELIPLMLPAGNG